MHRRRAGGAGVLDPGRTLEPQIRRRLQHQRGGEILRREAGIEMTEHDLVDIGRRHAGVGERAGRDPHDQALDGLAVELPERRMGPSDDASGHDASLMTVPCL